MPRKAERKDRTEASQCQLSSKRPSVFGKKISSALSRVLGIAHVAAIERQRAGQSSLFFQSTPPVQAEIRNEHRPVLPLGTGGRWLYVSIDLNAIGGARWRVSHISIGLLQGDSGGAKQVLLRAEWMMHEHEDRSGHAQPHWHVHSYEKDEKTANFEEVVAASSGFTGYLADEVAQDPSSQGFRGAAFDHFHYAMAADWELRPSIGPTKHLQDEAAVVAWIRGCVGYIVQQLEHVDRKAGIRRHEILRAPDTV